MKKILLSILWISFWLISFSSAWFVCSDSQQSTEDLEMSVWDTYTYALSWYYDIQQQFFTTLLISDWNTTYTSVSDVFGRNILLYFPISTSVSFTCTSAQWDTCWNYITYLDSNIDNCNNWWSSSSSDITVFYDYWHSSTSVVCNWDNSIFINWMANLSNQTTFTPFFNISYVDEDNQNLIESYSKDMLYLDNWQFKKTYTWDNQWILTVQNQWWSTPDIIFTWETLPVVVTWNSDNVFSNFGDNALMLISSNIPWIITWWFILFIILIIIRLFIPKNRR